MTPRVEDGIESLGRHVGQLAGVRQRLLRRLLRRPRRRVLVAIWLASDPDSRVLGLVSYAWAGFGAAFGPVVLFSLGWKRMTRNGALAGMVVGAATVIIWKQGAWFGLYEILPGVLFASIAIIIASLLGAPPSPAVAARDRRTGRSRWPWHPRVRPSQPVRWVNPGPRRP